MDVPTEFADNATTSAVAHYLHVPDPLVLEPCMSTRPHEWVDPMLKEFAASLVVSQPAGAPGCQLATVTAPQGVEALLANSSLAMACTTGSPTLSAGHEQPPVTPPQTGRVVEAEACFNTP